jgi:hypothetical protein
MLRENKNSKRTRLLRELWKILKWLKFNITWTWKKNIYNLKLNLTITMTRIPLYTRGHRLELIELLRKKNSLFSNRTLSLNLIDQLALIQNSLLAKFFSIEMPSFPEKFYILQQIYCWDINTLHKNKDCSMRITVLLSSIWKFRETSHSPSLEI